MSLTPSDTVQLVKILGMLGSAHDGEVTNAGRAAHRLVQAAGMTWSDIVEPDPGLALSVLWREPALGDHLDAALVCVYSGARLTTWDKRFLISISQRADPLSEKQQAQLDRIVDNCRLHACATE